MCELTFWFSGLLLLDYTVSDTILEWFEHILSILGTRNFGTQIKYLYILIPVKNIIFL